ncbi:hypothetical protein Moror_2008 [Moniliophthora roreri MCA 2997]|uniref:Uncharacterized protein n=1 Tax=Moniliophthora roreri (strain MCA 2997) TaxID=1381753 RepID=V2Y7A8_MONRO|nr:hypothetical protein Moror_2008 [Moniliophthora roreri MCA 2997]
MTADISSQRTSLKMMGISTGWETQNLGQRTGYWVLVELIEFGGLQNFRGIDDGIFPCQLQGLFSQVSPVEVENRYREGPVGISIGKGRKCQIATLRCWRKCIKKL